MVNMAGLVEISESVLAKKLKGNRFRRFVLVRFEMMREMKMR